MFAEKVRQIRVLEHGKQLNADPPEPASGTAALHSRVSNAPRKSTKTKKKYKLDPTDDEEGIQTHPVE